MRIIIIYLGYKYIVNIRECKEVRGWWDIEGIAEYDRIGREEYLSDMEIEILCMDGKFLYELNKEIREIITR